MASEVTTSDAISDEELAALAIIEQATRPGPWQLRDALDGDGFPGHLWVVDTVQDDSEDGNEAVVINIGDKTVGEFIAAARPAMPRLIAEVQRQRVEVERLKAANDRAWDVVQLLRFRAMAREEDPCGDPVGQLLSAALVGYPSHEEVRAEVRDLTSRVRIRDFIPREG